MIGCLHEFRGETTRLAFTHSYYDVLSCIALRRNVTDSYNMRLEPYSKVNFPLHIHHCVTIVTIFLLQSVLTQAGLPPNMDKDLYITVAKAVKDALPDIHLHAFSPEEIIYGAKRKKISVLKMITLLKDAGVNSFPGRNISFVERFNLSR